MKSKYDFGKIDGGPGLIELPEDVIRDLSTDQNLPYKRCLAAITGVLPRDVALHNSGKMGHSRWLTKLRLVLRCGSQNMVLRVSC
jgi:hypothetical protein